MRQFDDNNIHKEPSFPMLDQTTTGASTSSSEAQNSSTIDVSPLISKASSSEPMRQKSKIAAGSQTKNLRSRKQPVAPVPKKAYLEHAALLPRGLASPQPLLVILDINGTLLYRCHRRLPPSFVKRPGLSSFLAELLDRYMVMIWSSSQPPTVDAILKSLFQDFPERRCNIIAEWGRAKLGLTSSQYNRKVKVYKQLETVWADKTIQTKYPQSKDELGPEMFKRAFLQEKHQNEAGDIQETSHSLPFMWDQSNTVLIDDSSYKASGQPYNIIEVPEFTEKSKSVEANVFPMLLQKLTELSRSDDVSRRIRSWKMGINTNPGVSNLEACDKEIQDGIDDVANSGEVHGDIQTFLLGTASSSNPSKKRRKKKAKAAGLASTLQSAQAGQREPVAVKNSHPPIHHPRNIPILQETAKFSS